MRVPPCAVQRQLVDDRGDPGARAAVAFRERDLRVDGLPRADRKPDGPAVVLSFKAVGVFGSPFLRYEVGTFADWQDNVRAIALGLEALQATHPDHGGDATDFAAVQAARAS